MDHYNTLGVNRDALQDDIKRSYKKLAMRHHPDRGGDNNTFAKINEAYNTLKDPTTRQQYDRPPQPEMNINSGNMNDIFGAFFNQGRPIRQNADVTITIRISLEDVMFGKNVIGRYTLRSGEECVANLAIPQGIENGQVVQIRGLGDNTHPQLPRGNLNVQIIVLAHADFERDRLHLRTKCSINVLELMLGDTKNITTLGGGTLALKIPKGLNPGTILSVPGYGITDVRTGQTGNLYVEVKGITPDLDRYEDIAKVQALYDELNSRS